jgi:hypothetical protein
MQAASERRVATVGSTVVFISDKVRVGKFCTISAKNWTVVVATWKAESSLINVCHAELAKHLITLGLVIPA